MDEAKITDNFVFPSTSVSEFITFVLVDLLRTLVDQRLQALVQNTRQAPFGATLTRRSCGFIHNAFDLRLVSYE